MSLVEEAKNIIICLFLKILQWFSDIIINFLYRGPNVSLVPIREDCLLDSATVLAARIRTRKITSVEAVKACIHRIEEINDITNAVIAERFEEALKEAQAVDAFLAEESKSVADIERDTPFLGVPFSFKDGIALKGHVQSQGSILLKDTKADEDADVIALMKKAGAIPLASTNVPEYMMWWESSNRLYGKTLNPYHSKHTTGGSSGGEAALLSAAGSMMGIGSDLGGSIRLPCHMCGIFGHFPTRGTVSTKQNPPFPDVMKPLNTFGPMSKSAKDMLPMMKVLTKNAKELQLDTPVDIKKLRYYYIEDDGGHWLKNGVASTDKDTKRMMAAVVEYFWRTHGIVVEKVTISELKFGYNIWWSMMRQGDGNEIEYPGVVSVLTGLSKHAIFLAVFGYMEKFAPGKGDPKLEWYSKTRDILTNKLKDLLKDDAVLFYPTHPTPAFKHYASLFRPFDITYTAVFNATQLTATQCPILQTEEFLPVGVQVLAAPYQDRLTIAVAEELERGFGGWKPPPSRPKWS